MTMDDTANGTNTTDSQEQVVGTYMMPSVQERILNITKPDGTTSTEKQVSTTDTDFAAIEGEYAIGVIVSLLMAYQSRMRKHFKVFQQRQRIEQITQSCNR